MAGRPVLRRVDDALEVDLAPAKGYDFKDALDKVREIPGRRFDYDRKLWILPAEADVAERVMLTIQPVADRAIFDWIREAKTKAQDELTTPLPKDADLMIPWARERQEWQPEYVNDEAYDGLLQYQRPAVEALVGARRSILADDLGLGKTLTALSAVEEYRLRNARPDGVTYPEGPRLVVAPNSVKGSWLRELNRWLKDPSVVMVDGASPATRHRQVIEGIQENAWTIINWEQLRIRTETVQFTRQGGGQGKKKVKTMKEPLFQYPGALFDSRFPADLEDWDWRMFEKAKRAATKIKPGETSIMQGFLAVLADEIHRAKNKDAQQTQGLWRTQAPFMVAMTGTPVMNSPDELWPILKWLFPMEYTSYWDFYEKYVDYYENPIQGKVVTGVKNADALRFELKGRLFRRTSHVLGLKGRKRIYFNVPLNPKQRKLYEEAEKAMWLRVEQEIAQVDQLQDDYNAAVADHGEESEEATAAEAALNHAKTVRDSAEKFTLEADRGAPVANLIRIPNGAARMVRLLQIIENSALVGGDDDSAIMDDFEERLEDAGDDQQWVVGCKYRDSCDILRKRLEKKGVETGLYTGSVSPADRTALEDSFQKGETRVIVGTLDALKEGITLTSGHLMYMMSRFFVPDLNEQFEARCDRLGQQYQVLVYIPQAENSVATDKVEPINRVKERIVRSVVIKDDIQEVHE